MFTSKEVTRLTRTEDMLDWIYKVAERDAYDFMDKMNCNLFVRKEGEFARLAAKPLGTKKLEGFAPLCSIRGLAIASKLG